MPFGGEYVMIWKRSYGYQIFIIFYYICQICCLRLGLRSSGFTNDLLQAPSILIVIRVVQSTLMN